VHHSLWYGLPSPVPFRKKLGHIAPQCKEILRRNMSPPSRGIFSAKHYFRLSPAMAFRLTDINFRAESAGSKLNKFIFKFYG
jgi:hypothetical protein